MIVTETILKSIFAQLPDYSGTGKTVPIRFEWGDQADLILYLKQISGNKYPLIWLVSGDQSVDRIGRSVTRRCRFIIAKDSQHVTNRNPKVWETEFNDCLDPVLKNVYKALESSGVTTILTVENERREANYTEEDLSKATDFWNVIILDVSLKFTDNCINTIKF